MLFTILSLGVQNKHYINHQKGQQLPLVACAFFTILSEFHSFGSTEASAGPLLIKNMLPVLKFGTFHFCQPEYTCSISDQTNPEMSQNMLQQNIDSQCVINKMYRSYTAWWRR